jgi:hypothetical protein
MSARHHHRLTLPLAILLTAAADLPGLLATLARSLLPEVPTVNEHSDEFDHPVRGFRSPGAGGRVAADAGRFVPRLLTSFGLWA